MRTLACFTCSGIYLECVCQSILYINIQLNFFCQLIGIWYGIFFVLHSMYAYKLCVRKNQKNLFFAIECLIDSNEACYCLLLSFYLISLFFLFLKRFFLLSLLIHVLCVLFMSCDVCENNQSKVSNQHKHKIFTTVTYCSISISLITLYSCDEYIRNNAKKATTIYKRGDSGIQCCEKKEWCNWLKLLHLQI